MREPMPGCAVLLLLPSSCVGATTPTSVLRTAEARGGSWRWGEHRLSWHSGSGCALAWCAGLWDKRAPLPENLIPHDDRASALLQGQTHGPPAGL